MLDTFFFGYLSLKWKRLFRTISIVIFIGIPFYIDYPLYFHIDTVLIMLVFLLFVAITSYIVKPFIVKD